MARTVLLVDDDANLLGALQRALRREPYAIRVAESAAAAFETLRHHAVDVVISDEGMPGMSGTEFLTRVHAEHPDTIRIMLTGQASLELAVQAINEGHVYRFFAKPCNPAELAVAIRQGLLQRALLLESRRLLQTVRRQSAAMDDLERELRGGAHAGGADAGSELPSEVPTDLVALLNEVEAELATAGRRLSEREQEIRRRGERMLLERNGRVAIH